jgi:hypothetical protein
MKKIVAIALMLMFVSVASSQVVREIEKDLNNSDFNSGKNYFVLNSTEIVFAKDLVEKNPKIVSVSYLEDSNSIGYLNLFGGIGKNFQLEQNKVYEIFIREGSN